VDEPQVVHGVRCPKCNARVGKGCWWFYGYDLAASHPERWDQYNLYNAEREKLRQWNAGAKPEGEASQ